MLVLHQLGVVAVFPSLRQRQRVLKQTRGAEPSDIMTSLFSSRVCVPPPLTFSPLGFNTLGFLEKCICRLPSWLSVTDTFFRVLFPQ